MDKNILWLPSWYPTVIAPFEGDFIQRHAKAVSLYTNITVIHIKKDENSVVTKNVKEVVSQQKDLTEIIVYYHPFTTGIKLIDKIISTVKYKTTYRSALKKYIKNNDLPQLVHLHVALKAGVHAVWLNKKFGTPYIISEHWSGFLKENNSGINRLNHIQKSVLKKVFSSAKKIIVVSNTLGKEIKDFINVEYEIIPNVVDTSIFYPVEVSNKIPQFIHASYLTNEKNIEDIIEAFHLIKQKNIPFQFIIYGPLKKDLQILIEEKNIADNVLYKEEVPQAILAEDIKRSDALLLYSRYETFGCVIIEANACGVPVILSDLPVFKEFSVENKTAVYAAGSNPAELANTILNFISKRDSFSKSFISGYAHNKFSYEAVGKQFYETYKSILL